ncbi:Trp biosynthesis-associated membrane protein [Brevibacterium album]|uniref:Trp biosynthesis-associated membrane protein n=1 Tax=Brevibacterium album TaxID=417948 RepID=UPI0003FCFD5B|nr:Trp biosynthesis-associated membrane protein [Brevibacterium album]
MSRVLTKGRTLLALLVLAGALWYLSGLPWTSPGATAPTPVPGVAEVTGPDETVGSPLLTAAAAVLAVSALLLAMLGRAGRYVVFGLVGLIGAGCAGVALAAAGSAPAASVWPTAAAGVLVLALAVCAGAASRHWKASARYERARTAPADPEDDPTAAWDALSRGEDPS